MKYHCVPGDAAMKRDPKRSAGLGSLNNNNGPNHGRWGVERRRSGTNVSTQLSFPTMACGFGAFSFSVVDRFIIVDRIG